VVSTAVLPWVKPQKLPKDVTLTQLSLHRIQRGVGEIDKSNDVLIMGSFFYSEMESNGVNAVTKYTSKTKKRIDKSIDIFAKKLIFIPICQKGHWSLCVVVHPSAILDACNEKGTDDDHVACIICLDSLKAHPTASIRVMVMRWLNSEWIRLEKNIKRLVEPFTEGTLPLLTPKGKLTIFTDFGSFVMLAACSHIISFPSGPSR
jgi:hypothetical protein